MYFSCRLCERETVITSNLCDKCRRVKHLLNLYQDKVYDVLEEVLVRKDQGISNKCKDELIQQKNQVEQRIKIKK